jgi:hypothetical protein
MTEGEITLFSELIFSHKHLWVAFEVYRYLREHPEMDYDEVQGRFVEEAYEVYQSLADAVREEKPIAEALQTVLLFSKLTEAEIRGEWKRN